MFIELGILKDGRVILASTEPFPDIVKRVEFYKEQKLFNLVYHGNNEESDLMHREIPAHMVPRVEQSPEILIFNLFIDHEPIGYRVPLVQVGSNF